MTNVVQRKQRFEAAQIGNVDFGGIGLSAIVLKFTELVAGDAGDDLYGALTV